MAFDTFIAYGGVYPNVDDALADYDAVKRLHTEAGLIEAYDAAVVEKQGDRKVRIVKKHETPTRVGGVLGGGLGLASSRPIRPRSRRTPKPVARRQPQPGESRDWPTYGGTPD
jgi:hypothetical protein